jgi:localization factor PodJL
MAPHGGVPAPDFVPAALDERLDQLTRQIDRLVNAAAHSQDSVPQQMAQTISRLDQRLDQLVRQGRRAADELERRAGGIDRALANLGQERLRSTYVPTTAPRETIDQAVAEISARQRQLATAARGPEAYAPPPRPSPQEPSGKEAYARPPAAKEPPARDLPARDLPVRDLPVREAPVREPPTADLSGLQEQLRSITSRLESLNEPSGLAEAVAALRQELAQIGNALREAMPRRAVESLEAEIRKLADQITEGRQAGMGPAAMAGLERGLAELHAALRGLAPAESLVGFQEAIQALTRKVDLLSLGGANGADPATLEAIRSAVESLRGLVGHVASGEALASLATEVRALGEKIDRVTTRPADDFLKTLDRRINAIAEAIEAVRREGGRSVPDGFEQLIRSLNDKIEGLQLSRPDQLAIGALEERITRLVEKLDASEARLGHLGGIERGMAELLVHLEAMRAAQAAPVAVAPRAPEPRNAPPTAPPVDLLRRDVADIKQAQSTVGRRTEESLEAVHGTIGDVVNRLAMIESDLRTEPRLSPATPTEDDDKDKDEDIAAAAVPPKPVQAPLPQPPRAKAPAAPAAPTRQPIDPSLPPDFPLEPGSGAPRGRGAGGPERSAPDLSARVARPEPPAGAGGEAPNFLEAARRAAKAAALQQVSDDKPGEAGASPLSDRLKQLFVGAGVVLAVAGAFRFAGMYLDPERVILADAPAPRAETAPTSATLSSTARAIAVPGLAELVPPPARSLPAIAPPSVAITVGDGSFAAAPPSGAITSERPQPSAVAAAGQRADITGSVPSGRGPAIITASPLPAPAAPATPAAPAAAEPAASAAVPAAPPPADGIGRGMLAAATAGNPAAAYEVASRYADGRGVPQSYKDAVTWYERAAKSGIAIAQFRLGSMYEKGLGVQKDLKEARRLYLAAADQGNAKAMHNIAVLYAEGIDGKPDYRSASQWFRKAADRGVADSQYNLAILYARGIGVDPDLAQSYKWFALAAANGDKEAGKKRDDVAGRLDPGRLVQAREAVASFVATPQPEEAISVKLPPEGWEKASRPMAAPAKGRDRVQKQASVLR